LIPQFLVAYQAIITFLEYDKRKKVYLLASNYAKSLNKPLVVVGGYNFQQWGIDFDIPVHGQGDLCIDIKPSACYNSNFLQADIRNIPLPDKYAGAVYCSHVLEHLKTIPDAVLAYKELSRIADKVFLCYPSKLNISAWVHPDHYLWIDEKPDKIEFQTK
jgi:hypothetical protein